MDIDKCGEGKDEIDIDKDMVDTDYKDSEDMSLRTRTG